MVTQHPVNERVNSIIEEITSTKGVKECALVARDGILVGKRCRESIPAPSVAAMTASMFASAEAASSMLEISEPSHLIAFTKDTLLLVMSLGETMLVSATVDRSIDFPPVCKRLQEIATKIGGEVVV
ncbi:MAG: roadblock/LC7 domain-containing protein [Methanomicrobiales archaeon]|nr:roadblock/LC7 domain-containing protein [Methanomicrobiales archaeon]